jgi:hypothetical protein
VRQLPVSDLIVVVKSCSEPVVTAGGVGAGILEMAIGNDSLPVGDRNADLDARRC